MDRLDKLAPALIIGEIVLLPPRVALGVDGYGQFDPKVLAEVRKESWTSGSMTRKLFALG